MAENRSSHRNNDGSLFRESSKLFIQFYLFPADSSSKKSETAEGILLAPVYNGKAFAGMLDLIEKE